MNKTNFIKGMGLGIVVGSVVGMAVSPRKKHSGLGKALKAMGNVVEGITNSLGI